ncbi:MAG: TerB family tellurite resistance protein [Proteobacteria bacterium]|nr:TerB family tellurite resistance protein [Pseudomonadota bacterium]
MGLSGKLLGAGIGYFLGGPLGAVLGGVIGHYVKDAPLGDGLARPEADPRVRQQQQELHFVASLVGILTAMIKADGDVRQEEVRAVRTFFSERLGYRGESLEIVRDLIKQFLRAGVDLDALCGDFVLRSDYATRLLLVECMLEVALADGHLAPAEEAVFDRAVGLLGIAAADLVNLRSRGKPHADYDILGLPPSAGVDEVKRAYRELAKKYHPDMVAHLGVEFRDLANRKFLEVQQAYDRIRAARGWA